MIGALRHLAVSVIGALGRLAVSVIGALGRLAVSVIGALGRLAVSVIGALGRLAVSVIGAFLLFSDEACDKGISGSRGPDGDRQVCGGFYCRSFLPDRHLPHGGKAATDCTKLLDTITAKTRAVSSQQGGFTSIVPLSCTDFLLDIWLYLIIY